MPHIAETGFPKLPSFLNLDAPIGKGCRNSAEDIRLVQYMLQRLYSQTSVRLSNSATACWAGLRQPLACNGQYDLATRISIFRFQIDLSRHYGTQILIDGRLDPSVTTDSPIAHLSRIYQLNFPQDYQKLVRSCPDISGAGAISERTETRCGLRSA